MVKVREFLSRRGPLLAFLVLAVGIAGAFYFSTHNQLNREREAQVFTCTRVQILRDQANGQAFLIYNTFKQVADQQRAVIESGKLKGPALKQARQSLKRAARVVKTTVVTGPTDCIAATDSPRSYRAPAPEFIAKGGARVRVAKERADLIVTKARLGQPLYGPLDAP
jgi:hypothetical protein